MPSIAMARAYQVVPFHLAKNGLVEIHVVVNGKVIRGLLDSGTGALIVSRAFAGASGLVVGKAATTVSGVGEKPQPVTITAFLAVRMLQLAYSGPCRPPIPEHAGRGFRSMPAIHSGPCRQG
ncbi:MAG: hypothetical protein ACRET0_10900 [Steroidobacteraceae bacterium]